MSEGKASDRYLTVGPALEILDAMWPRGASLDPFHDPAGPALGRQVLDARNGDDAYAQDWLFESDMAGPDCERRTAWVNGPYSGSNPQETAKRCAIFSAHMEILNLCPAAPGSAYWKRWVWPYAAAVAWCGRYSFRAAVDIVGKDGAVRCKAGTVANGNRTEIALVYYGKRSERFAKLAETIGGFPVVRP